MIGQALQCYRCEHNFECGKNGDDDYGRVINCTCKNYHAACFNKPVKEGKKTPLLFSLSHVHLNLYSQELIWWVQVFICPFTNT